MSVRLPIQGQGADYLFKVKVFEQRLGSLGAADRRLELTVDEHVVGIDLIG